MSTSINSSTGLPNIPSLPPIEIPSASFRTSTSVDHHLPPLDEDSLLSPHAYSFSPPPHRQPAGSSNDNSRSSPNVSPISPNLRKSFSVDSFSRHSRSSPVSIVGRQQKATPVASPTDEQRRGPVPTWQPQAVGSPQVSYLPRDPAFPLSGRSRGASVSTVGDEPSQPILEESDGEPVRDAPQIAAGVRRTGTKNKGKLRPTLPPGELPLPSKLHGANPATPAITDTSNDSTPWLPMIITESVSHRSPKAGPSRRQSNEDIMSAGSTSNSSTSGLDSGGIRSQSVRFSLPSCLPYAILNDIKITIAVIGEKGCGKSAAISKGLKAYRLADPVTTTDSPEDDALLQCAYTDLSNKIMCVIICLTSDTLREGKVADGQGVGAVLNVLEVDTAVLKARRESSHGMWPGRAPPLDGVMVCYDVSRKDSFTEVEDILRL